MRKIASYIVFFAAAGSLAALAAQTPASNPRPSLIEELNQEASSMDAAGLHAYSKELTETLVENFGGPAYNASVADRLARAELDVRQGKRKLISESEILAAFNELMRKTGAPDSLLASLDEVRKNRQAFASEAPQLITTQSNGSYCNPGEAIWVLEMMIANVGAVRATALQAGPHAVAFTMPPVRSHLQVYFARHSRTDAVRAFNQVLSVLKI